MPQLFALLMVTKKTCTLVVDLNQNAAVSEESFLLSMQKSTKFQKVTRERVPTEGYSSPRYLGGVCCNGEGKKENFPDFQQYCPLPKDKLRPVFVRKRGRRFIGGAL